METTPNINPESFMTSKLSKARGNTSNALLRQYASRILEVVVAHDSNPANSKKPYLDCIIPAVETSIVLEQTPKLIAQLRLKPPTVVLRLTTIAMRTMFEDVPFDVLLPR